MNQKQILSIGVGCALGTSIGAITDDVAMSIVYGSITGTIIGAALALVVFKENKTEE